MAKYGQAKVKLTNNQLKKLESPSKNKTGKTLRVTNKNFQDEELRKAFANKMLTDIKLSKSQLSKKIRYMDFLVLGYTNLVVH